MDYKRFLRGPGVYLLLLIGVILLTRLFSWGAVDPAKKEIDYSSVLRLIEEDKVDHIAIGYETLVGMYKTGQTVSLDQFPSKFDFSCVPPRDDKQFYSDVNAIYASKLNKSVQEISPADYSFKLSNLPTPVTPWWLEMVPFLIAIVLIGVLWMVLMRQQQGGNSKVMSFGKSRARMNDSDKNKKTFADIKGADEEKEELREIVEFLKNPRRFTEVGARIPKGVLLVGPPGTGKTLFAKAVAGEAGVPFFSISGSDFVEMFVGVGASRVRDLFDQAKRNLPSIVFIDEIDAVGRHRGAGLGGGHDEREQTLNQLLVEMDGFAPNEGVIIFAATNRPDILDPALLRPGRFDRQVTVHYPDVKGRKEILELYAHGKPLGKEVDLEVLAKRTPFSSPADLENIMNEAALLTARAGKLEIGVKELEEAVTRVQMGPEKKSRVVTDKDRKLVAYHEAGHALVAHEMPNCDPVHEICIIPRGRAAGYTTMLPSEEYSNVSRSRLLDIVAELLGGHAAEKLVLEDVSTGSTSDLQRATEIVRNMITQYGMSDELGPVYLGGEQEVFIGRDFTSSRNYSEHVAMMIDRETKTLLESAYELAEKTLKKNVAKLHAIAKRLLDKEKVDHDEFEDIMRSEQPDEMLIEAVDAEPV